MSKHFGWRLTSKLRDEIYKYAKYQPTGVSLRQMVQFGPKPSEGSLFHASRFVVEELPIRLAHRVKELEELPNELNKDPSIELVRDWYAQSFDELISIPKPEIDEELKILLYKNVNESGSSSHSSISKPNNHIIFEDDGVIVPRRRYTHSHSTDSSHHLHSSGGSGGFHPLDPDFSSSKKYYIPCSKNLNYPPEIVDYNRLVTETLTKIKKRHDATVPTIAKGVQNWKKIVNASFVDNNMQSFLDRFYMSRIGIRMLIGQQIAISHQYKSSSFNNYNDDYVGIICLHTNVSEIAQDAIDSARFTCEEHYGLFEAPKVQLYCPEDLNFMYVPGHLVHMLFETLKNSLRATVENQMRLNPDKDIDDLEFPPIKIIIAEGEEDITIKISDEGGGIPRSAIPLIWTYLYTTVDDLPNSESSGIAKSDYRAPMAGYGYGLPISRLYARYFGGDLKLISMEGYGTDVYLHLNRLSSSSEPLQ